MHRCLLISEILETIFSSGYLSPDVSSSLLTSWTPQYEAYFADRKSTLYALAMTCRTFKEPALDALWSILYSIEPLLRCVMLHEETVYYDATRLVCVHEECEIILS